MAVTRLRPPYRQSRARRMGHPKLDVVVERPGHPPIVNSFGRKGELDLAATNRRLLRSSRSGVSYLSLNLSLDLSIF